MEKYVIALVKLDVHDNFWSFSCCQVLLNCQVLATYRPNATTVCDPLITYASLLLYSDPDWFVRELLSYAKSKTEVSIKFRARAFRMCTNIFTNSVDTLRHQFA